MAKFTYMGKTKAGEAVTQTVEAEDKYAVYAIARGNGHIVTKVSTTKTFSVGTIFSMEKVNYFLNRVKPDELVVTTRNIAAMLKAGLSLSRALSVIERQTQNPKLKGIVKQIREQITRGDSFHVALSSFPNTFSPLFVAMVRAGEESGGLQEALMTLSTQLERASTLRKKIKGAMIYPAIVLSIMVLIGVLMMIYVVPTLTATFEKIEADLPLTTQLIIGSSDFISQYGLFVILGILLGLVGIVSFFKTKNGKKILHFSILRIPAIGKIVKETNSAYTARTLASLLASGVDVISALKITEDVLQNVYYKEVLREAAEKVEKGEPLSDTFIAHGTLYPVLVGEMILVGEETGQISTMMDELAAFYEEEVSQKTKDLSTIIEPILMVVIGGGVGFFALAMIAPIYSISETI